MKNKKKQKKKITAPVIGYSFTASLNPKVNASSIFSQLTSQSVYKCHMRDFMFFFLLFLFANAISHNFGETSLPRLGEKRCALELKINKF